MHCARQHVGDTGNASWWLNLPFCHIVGCATAFSSSWCNACRRWLKNLSQASLIFLLLLSLISKKLEIGLLCFWYFYFNHFSFDFLFFFLVLYKGFISFQFSSSILTYHIIYFSLVLILLFSLLLEKLQIGLLCFLYFYFGHYFIDCLFFSFVFS